MSDLPVFTREADKRIAELEKAIERLNRRIESLKPILMHHDNPDLKHLPDGSLVLLQRNLPPLNGEQK